MSYFLHIYLSRYSIHTISSHRYNWGMSVLKAVLILSVSYFYIYSCIKHVFIRPYLFRCVSIFDAFSLNDSVTVTLAHPSPKFAYIFHMIKYNEIFSKWFSYCYTRSSFTQNLLIVFIWLNITKFRKKMYIYICIL